MTPGTSLARRRIIAVRTASGRIAPLGDAGPSGGESPIQPWISEGREVYRRGLILALDEACRRVFPHSVLWVEHSISLGYRCRIDPKPRISSVDVVRMLAEALEEVVSEGLPIRYRALSGSERELYELVTWSDGPDPVMVNELGESRAFAMGPAVPDTSWLETWEIRPQGEAFVLRFPGSASWPKIGRWMKRPKLAREFDLEEKHIARMRVRTIDELNQRIEEDGGLELVIMSHFYQNYRIVEIVKALEAQFPARRIITIAGPSSSGKTTIATLLSTYLRAQGFGARTLSVDNYFRHRSETPLDERGNPDFESLQALETDMFGRDLRRLLQGEEIALPEFDFEEGVRHDDVTPMKLDENEFLLIEGIHGLNDDLTPGVDPAEKYRVYCSALTQLNIDRLTRMSTSDSRLLRRMVRDSFSRGYTAHETISNWPMVRRGERRNIFPFQEKADAVFNSSLPYELPVLKPFAEPLLDLVPEGCLEFGTADRLMRLLNCVKAIDASIVPRLSLLREFIDGSLFDEEGD